MHLPSRTGPSVARASALVLLVLAGVAHAQDEDTKRYDLRPHYTLGDKQEVEARLSMLLKVRLVLASQGIDRTSEQEQVIQRHYQDTLAKVVKGKVDQVERKFSSAWTGTRDPGSPSLARELDPQHQRTIVIGRGQDGKRKVWARHGQIDKAAVSGEMPTERYDSALPKTRVAIGETWEVTGPDFQRAIGKGLGHAPKGKISCTFKEITKVSIQGEEAPEPIALVELQVEASARNGTEEDAPRMVINMKGRLRFSLKRHKIVTVDLRGEARLRQTRREGDEVLELDGRGPISIKKRAWFPAKPRRKR
jgi:hypothetical protein